MKAVICDIDGTVAIMDGQRGPYDYSKVHLDKPNANVVELVRVLRAADYRIIFVSGRDDECMPQTRQWLVTSKVGLPGDRLWMRKTGDFRPDEIVKEEIYRGLIEPFHEVFLVLDDRNKVVNMWRRLGLTCLQVADGEF